jgi:hypothetical protein
MFDSNNVIGFVREKRLAIWHKTILALSPSAFTNFAAECSADPFSHAPLFP